MEINNKPILLPQTGSSVLYFNNFEPSSEEQITDVTSFTKVYRTDLSYGQNGAKVSANLDLTDETIITSNMSGGWAASNAAYYEVENLRGAYAGYNFGEEIFINKVKIWLGKYSQQNATLCITVEYLNNLGSWVKIQDLNVSSSISYPLNIFTVPIYKPICGIRWIHTLYPDKYSGNNVVFFGLTIYKGMNLVPVYIPESDASGLIQPPPGYDGFYNLYL